MVKIKAGITLIPGLFYLHVPIFNPGIAFGVMSRNLLLSAFLSILALYLVVFATLRLPAYRVPLYILLAGALSNVLDRIFRAGVVDYLSLKGFPWSFNLADTFIIWGTLHYLIISMRKDVPNTV
ncbi:MAG: signal peptidase II [Caldiserica bacterium]|nr:signal peptidase II [Caldisericota bacterium]